MKPPLPNAPSIVACRRVTKHFGAGENRLKVIHGVDLDIRAGELTLLVGPSGCGKTTLLSLIAGLLDPTAGQVQVLDTTISNLSADQRTLFRRKHIGFVFQQYQLLPALTAVENAAVPLLVKRVKRRVALQRAAKILESLEMGHRLHSLPTRLSYGQQQRVAIARAIIHEPCLLVCDEPTAALDGQTGRLVMQILVETAVRPDRAVLVVTHDSRVLEFGHRVVEMNDGRIVPYQGHFIAPDLMDGQT